MEIYTKKDDSRVLEVPCKNSGVYHFIDMEPENLDPVKETAEIIKTMQAYIKEEEKCSP
jgi:hypothetical protein